MAKSYAVLGLSTFGYQMAVGLKEAGAQVLVIDLDEKAIQRISNLVTKAVAADLRNEQTLSHLGVYESDAAIISMPDHFDITVLVTHFLKRGGVPEILVQVESEAQASAIQAVGATQAIFPERDLADRTVRQLFTPTIADQIPLGEDVSIIEVPCPEVWNGKTLLELQLRTRHHVYVIGIKKQTGADRRSEKVEILPVPDRPLKGGDILLILGKLDRLTSFRKSLPAE